MARGRKKLILDKEEFQKNISLLEEAKSYSTWSEIFIDLCQTEWARSQQPRALTPSVVFLRVNEMGIILKTPKGRRGNAKGFPGASPAASPKVKSRPRKADKKAYEAIKSKVERGCPTLLRVVEKWGNGSQKAAIKLGCMLCTGYNRKEIYGCSSYLCPWHPYRPFQESSSETE